MSETRRDDEIEVMETSTSARLEDGVGQGTWLPELPPGFTAQPNWGCHDPTGRFAFVFNRVYGPVGRPDDPEPRRELDEGLSYWSVSWPMLGETGYERPGGRWVSHAQVRAQGRRLSFDQFSSLPQMMSELPAMLRVEAMPGQ